MKICLAQTQPQRGDVEANITAHKRLIGLAATNDSEIIIFPELSLTGYEPSMAKALALTSDDHRLEGFQFLANSHSITICLGAPIQLNEEICIAMLIFHPNRSMQIYFKEYLHKDEEDFFVSHQNDSLLMNHYPNIALAICYELSVSEHAEKAATSGADFYVASVAKTAGGVEKSYKRLSEIASAHQMIVLMANCVGLSEEGLCAGQSAVWNSDGIPIGQLDDSNEGLLIFDTKTQGATKIPIPVH